ncbi:MAG: DNA cytosine methyltransferase, partial [Spirochaetaceae bacterium]
MGDTHAMGSDNIHNDQKAELTLSSVSLFSGIGGLDLGLIAVGSRIRVSIDHSHDALSVHDHLTHTPSLEADLSTFSAPAFDVDVVVGGPPCTAFSHAGYWIERKRNGTDAETGRIHDFSRIVNEIRPRLFVMENVPGLLYKTHRNQLDRLVQTFRAGGYTVHGPFKADASHYGVPQKRRRVFIIGTLSSREFQFPTPLTHDSPRSAGWAFQGLNDENCPAERGEQIPIKYAELLKEVPPGGNYLHFTEQRGYPYPRFKWRSKYWSFLLKIDPNLPSPTVPATRVTYNGPFHWDNRHLRYRERCRLQTLPDHTCPIDVAPASYHVG